MHVCELESSLMNKVKPAKHINELVEMCDDRLVIKSFQQARDIIKKLVTTIKDGQSENLIMENDLQVSKNSFTLYKERFEGMD